MDRSRGHPIVLYDGVCGLCNRLVRFILEHDHAGQFRFASLQGGPAVRTLERHGRDPRDLSTMYVVVHWGEVEERLLEKSRAILFILGRFGGLWSLARVLGVLPAGVLDVGYDLVARHRYRFFGKLESCPVPAEAWRERFLDDLRPARPADPAGSGSAR